MNTLESQPSRPQPTGLQVELSGKPGRRLSVRLLILLFLSLAVVGSATVWLNAQPRRGTGTFGPIGATPTAIAVNTPTPVTFTAQITDRQLKKRSVILLRLDAFDQPSEILGLLKDDGRNGDVRANDNIYTFRTTLNAPDIGQVGFRVAARFKPGKWREPDDDDWDKDLAALNDRKARGSRRDGLPPLLRKLQRYTLTDPIQVTVVPPTPETVLSSLAASLAKGDVDAAMAAFSEGRATSDREFLTSLTPDRLKDYAYFFANARLVDQGGRIHVYTGPFRERDGTLSDVEFMMSIDDAGVWRINSW